jgi:hypothetical protein
MSTLFLMRKWLRTYLVTAIMLLALLLPIYGPWLDFRFAERMPQHDHIFIGEVNLDHHNQHYHKHVPTKMKHPKNDLQLPLPAVINLPDQDAALWGLIMLGCPNNRLSCQRLDTLRFPLVEARYNISAIVVPPLDQPPRF